MDDEKRDVAARPAEEESGKAGEAVEAPIGDSGPVKAQAEIDETLDEMDGTFDELEEQLRKLEKAERAVDSAYSTGRAERARITQAAQLDAAEAVAMTGIAMESDIEADEAMKIAVIAEKSGDREKARTARKKERDAKRRARNDHRAATKSAKQAYDAIRFSDPNSMGLLRLIQVLFAIHIGVTLVWLMLTSRDAFAETYSVNTAIDWLVLIAEGCGFWMLLKRFRISRPFICALCIFALIAPAIIDIASGRFNVFALAFNGAFYVVVLIYLLTSSRAKATLVNEIGKDKESFDDDDFVIDRRGWPFVRNLIIYFIVFSVLGHAMEMGMCQFIILGLVQGEYDPSNTMLWRDWLYPFPMEGAAVVVIALVLYPFFERLKKKFTGKKRIWAYVISFFAGALLCTVIEGGMGLIVNADLQLWDYRNNFCNIGGQVCLQNTAAFGVVAAIITWWVYPAMERWIAKVPRSTMNLIFVAVAIFGGIIWSLYIIDPGDSGNANDPVQAEKVRAEKEASERESLASSLEFVISGENAVKDAVKSSNYLSEEEKARIVSDIDKLKSDTGNVQDEIANPRPGLATDAGKS